jgi:glycosyltransferase involved in cell wall biosynthesis
MIEAMACGTPVIAWPCGSVPEVVDDGVTGLLVGDVDMAVSAVGQIASLDRRRVREVFERRFSAEAMARAYLDLYESLVAGAPCAKKARRPARTATAPWIDPPAAILPTRVPRA